VRQGRPDTGKNIGFGDVTGAETGAGTNPGELMPGEAGTPPVINEVKSPGSEICCGSGTGRNGICGRFSCAWGSNPAGPVVGAAAGTVGVNPGMPVSPGAGAAGAARVGVNPGTPSPGVAVVAAGAAPGNSDVAPGTAELAPGRPAVDGCGTLIAALANGGGVCGCPPRAPAMFCSTWGAPAAEVTNCCPIFGAGTGGAGSAWAVPIKLPVSSAADEPATTAVARNNVQMVDMTLPGSR